MSRSSPRLALIIICTCIARDESSATTSTIDWKRVFVRGLRTRERNAFFDIMIRRTSDQTLFNISMSQIPEEAMNITNFGRCEECVREESAEEGTNLDYLSTSSPSRLHSLLWDHNFHEYSQPRSRSDFLRHTLKLGCIWADSPRVKVPKEFLLDYNRMNFRRRAARGRPSRDTALLDIDLSSLALGSSPSSSLGSYPSLSSSPF